MAEDVIDIMAHGAGPERSHFYPTAPNLGACDILTLGRKEDR